MQHIRAKANIEQMLDMRPATNTPQMIARPGLLTKRLTVVLVLLCQGCSSDQVELRDAELLSGRALFGSTVESAPGIDVLAIDDSVRHWARARAPRSLSATNRLRALLQGMIDDGLLNLSYDALHTQTAQETFVSRRGNCLSFSTLFVALAREVGLDVVFQMVDIPPTFSATGETVLLNSHINVLVQNVFTNGKFRRMHIVDFNSAEYNGNYDTTVVSDDYALSLYHGNLAVEALSANDSRLAFRHLKRALEMSPDVPGLWVNLGVLYARAGHTERAALAYARALTIDDGYRSALVNLARLARDQNDQERLRYYERRIERHLAINPYYHLQDARTALAQGRLEQAGKHIATAISLKDDEHQFHDLAARIYLAQGRLDLARRSLKTAQKLAQNPSVAATYAEKLNQLARP